MSQAESSEAWRNSDPVLSACSKQLIAAPQKSALFLDLDGTLLDVATTPKGVHVPHGLTELLASLETALDGALAIVTGRHIEDIDRLLAPLRLAASGVHGTELRRTHSDTVLEVSPQIPADIHHRVAAIAAGIPGAFAESKTAAIALHYRLAPEAEALIETELTRVLDLHAGRYRLCRGRKVFEVLPAGLSKGSALTAFLEDPHFLGRTPIMIGDDVGDEPAFEVARNFSGFALKVAGENFAPETAHFSGPQHVRSWLKDIASRQSTAGTLGGRFNEL